MANKNEVGICNLALTTLSTSRIASLTEDSENARKCNALYSLTRDSMLTQHYFNFSLKEASLATVDDDPTIEDWAYIFQLPSDCLLVSYNEGNYAYAVLGTKLYSNNSTCNIRYVARITNPQLFSNGFVSALAARLAADMCFGVTQNATLTKLMEAKATLALNEAKWTDAQEGIGNYPIKSSLKVARQG